MTPAQVGKFCVDIRHADAENSHSDAVSPSTRLIGLTGIAGLVIVGALLGPMMRAADPPVHGAAQAGGAVVFAHRGFPELTEVGFRSAREMQLTGRIENGRDATGPTFVLVEPSGQNVRIAYANGGDPALRLVLEKCRDGSTYSVTGTVLDWGRGIRSFNMGKPLTISR